MQHYNEAYFVWQKKIGKFGGIANRFKFDKYINSNHSVIEFGCGGGYLLKNLNCKNKIGIEINSAAIEMAKKNNIVTITDIALVSDCWADVIISNHALEHVENPIIILKELYKKLKKKGTIIFVVPQEFKNKYAENDINQHLYTWTPLNLGNLFKTAGFKIIVAYTLKHKWPPFYLHIYNLFGKKIFNFLSYLYCILTRKGYQTIIVATKDK